MSCESPKHNYNTRSKAKQQALESSKKLKVKDHDDQEDDNKNGNKPKKGLELFLFHIFNNIANKRKKPSDDDEDDDSNEPISKKIKLNNDEEDDDDELIMGDDDDEYDEDEEEYEDDPFFLDEDEEKRNTLLEEIEDSLLPDNIKNHVLEQVKNSNDITKIQEWAKNVMKIPFNKYISIPVDLSSNKVDIINFFKNAKSTLDSVVYGMDNVKEEMMNYIAQFVSNKESKPRVLALHGSAGVGKTVVIRKGLSKILNRPIKCISMGGINDSSTFNGFEYTYVGSKYGIISRSLIECGVMNPIIYMDELDKISDTPTGQDIMNFLIHVTDPEQTATFEDKYFNGINIDLSKVLFVFSFNDESRISPILLDRLNVIKVEDPSVKEKMVIAKDYILKDVCKNIGFPETEVEFTEQAIRNIVSNSSSHGLRDIKRRLETIIMKVNTMRLTDGEINFSFNIKPKEIEQEELMVCSGKKRLKKNVITKKKVFVIDDEKVRKLYKESRDDTSYKMMFM